MPELPHELAKDGGYALRLEESNYPEKGGHYVRVSGSGIGVFTTPAQIVRETLPFVPEDVRIREGWQRLDGAPEAEPVAWLDSDGDFFVTDTRHPAGHNITHREVFSMEDCDLENYTALYAHPPVTAEPATAPSVCGATVGPVPKLDGERFICALATGHDGDHEAIDGTWFVDSIARYPAPSVEQIANVLSESLGTASDYQVAVKLHGMFAAAGDAALAEVERYKALVDAYHEALEAEQEWRLAGYAHRAAEGDQMVARMNLAAALAAVEADRKSVV